jgi:predicted dithiol-disulfide oxidoreductase (DUF899 family)
MTLLEQSAAAVPEIVDRVAYQARVDALRTREKAHTREADAIAAARRRLPMVEVNANARLVSDHGEVTLLDAFEGRHILIAYYHMWHAGKPAAGQCEGCTFFTSQVHELSYLHVRDVTYATFSQGPFDASVRYAGFMGYAMPMYSALDSLETLLAGRKKNTMYLICYLRQGSKVFETYWTTMRGVEAMDNAYHLLDMTVHGRQEKWEDSPAGWPQQGEGSARMRTGTRPTAQWERLKAGRPDALGDETR